MVPQFLRRLQVKRTQVPRSSSWIPGPLSLRRINRRQPRSPSSSYMTCIPSAEELQDVQMTDVVGMAEAEEDLRHGAAPSWCEDFGLLHSWFSFVHQDPPQQQSPGAVKKLIEVFQRFLGDLGGQFTPATQLDQMADPEDKKSSEPMDVEGQMPYHPWPTLREEDLVTLKEAMQTISAADVIEWMPEFGCALMAVGQSHEVDIGSVAGQVHVQVVALDAWRFRVHSSPSMSHNTAHCSGSAVLSGCTIAAEQFVDLIASVHQLLGERKKQKREGEDKTFQRTPAFVQAVVKDAHQMIMGGRKEATAPLGGTTDVGPHTGGVARDTTAALFREVLKVVLEEKGTHDALHLHEAALAHFDLWLLVRQLDLVTPATAIRDMLSACVTMLRSVTVRAATLALDHQDVTWLEQQCGEANAHLQTVARDRARRVAIRHSLPEPSSRWGIDWHYPPGLIPSGELPGLQGGGLAAARLRAVKNLGSLHVPSTGPKTPLVETLRKLCELMKVHGKMEPSGGTASGADLGPYLSLSAVEEVLYKVALLGFDIQQHHLKGPAEVAVLEELVDEYCHASELLRRSSYGPAHMLVELRSRAVLVVWVAYCITWVSVVQRNPILARYGVALRPDDLQHLSLSDKKAVDAALGVAGFLNAHWKEGQAVFSLTPDLLNGKPTFTLAEQYAVRDDHMMAVWRQEQDAAQKRERGHWAMIEEKRRQAENLKGELRVLESQLSMEKAEENAAWVAYQNCSSEHWQSRSRHRRYKDACAKVSSLQSAISSVNQKLEQAQKAPPPVIQPLPRAQSSALKWIFFLHMPQDFRQLGRLSFLGQQMLLPLPCLAYQGVQEAVAMKGLATSLCGHYNLHQECQYYTPVCPYKGHDGRQLELMSSGAVPQQVGPKHIDCFTTMQDGVWYPDSLAPQMAWLGSGSAADTLMGLPSGYFNPFMVVDNAARVDSFTERLPAEVAQLQWVMPQYGSRQKTAVDRGNRCIAQQDTKPSWLTRWAYQDFCNLRAYPFTQLRKLCEILRERRQSRMVFHHPAVRTLFQQTMYHLGTLSFSRPGPGQLLWREEWGQMGDVLETLTLELKVMAEELNEAPREHEAILAVGEMAAYVSCWWSSCSEVSDRFAAMSSRVADELQDSINKLVQEGGLRNEEIALELQAKQCHARMMGLLCYGAGQTLSYDQTGKLMRLLVLIKHGDVFFQETSIRQQLAGLRTKCHRVVARRLSEILSVLMAQDQRNTVLTRAVKAIIHSAPLDLKWSCVAPGDGKFKSTGSFESVGNDGHLYSINILDGTVLFDGCPPGRLPLEVLQHPLYVRTFGSTNFEVGTSADGALMTLKPVQGRYYEFYLTTNNQQLVVTEVERGQEVIRLQLLDPGDDQSCHSWGSNLPPRLRMLHSHWLHRAEDLILLRPRSFQQHDTQFILKCRGQGATTPTHLTCWKVPHHLQQCHWRDLHHSHVDEVTADELIYIDACPFLTMLTKVESSELIHVYKPANACTADAATKRYRGEMRYELPRYNLEFRLHHGHLISRDYRDYRLRRVQQLVEQEGEEGPIRYHTLLDFKQYLVLELIPGSEIVVGAPRPDYLVLVPQGVVENPGGKVCVRQPADCSANLKMHSYEVHSRFGHLQARDISARLQLAALYAATSSLLPEPASMMTGAQMAMQLVRQCWGNKPLDPQDYQQLESISSLGGHLAPALRALAYEVKTSAEELSFLYGQCSGVDPGPGLPPDHATSYRCERSEQLPGGWGLSPRLCLSRDEEVRLLKGSPRRDEEYLWKRQQYYKTVNLPYFPIRESLVAHAEERLNALMVQEEDMWGPEPYPLKEDHSTPLARDMHKELRASWDIDQCHPVPSSFVPEAPEVIQEMLGTTTSARQEVEDYLNVHLYSVPYDTGDAGSAFRLLRLSGAIPTHSSLDLLRTAWQTELFQQFNPFLSPDSVHHLHQVVLYWLQLCVLEDRLVRLTNMMDMLNVPTPTVLQELSVKRMWDPRNHPQWLVFEVEGQFQIRPSQYALALHLMNMSGDIAQLNMGEGKTRVILPMLVMHWADGSQLVRLNFLTPLLPEAYRHLHRHLCGSVLQRKLFLMPFHRDVDLSEAQARCLETSLNHCQQVGGMLLVAPEHRLSLLELKLIELKGDRPRTSTILMKLAARNYVDIIDESDEILHNRYQIQYACGAVVSLPAREERVLVVQTLLRALNRLTDSGALRELRQGVVAVWEESKRRSRPGCFNGFRLLAGHALEALIPTLHKWMVMEVITRPPYEMSWLLECQMKETIIQAAIDPTQHGEQALNALRPHLAQEQLHQVLALRGMLACNLLAHGLKRRHGVDYGVNRSPIAKKRLAVPYRAAATPSERSEFSQPDMALIWTHISYYHDGLTKKDLKAAVEVLLGMGLNAQRYFYKQWLDLSKDNMAPGHLSGLDDVSKLDNTNSQQVDLLHRYFSHNVAAIDFWLTFIVLPVETGQYPYHLACNAWHLATNRQGKVVGFSGTNDNHRLLPLQVKQADLSHLPYVSGTNGKMLKALLTLAEYSTLTPQVDKATWKVLLEKAVTMRLQALLDAGALLAGVDNRQAAYHVLAQFGPQCPYQGVTYYDPTTKDWVILDTRGRGLPRSASPVPERDTFVIYDDARCRGADLQLLPSAKALLTLGPGMTKDKLMQAAGRMRQLGRGQTLHVMGLPDITKKIREVSQRAGMVAYQSVMRWPVRWAVGDPKMREVLQWITDNTIKASLSGVLQWAGHGLHFAVTKALPQEVHVPEKLNLEEFYGSGRAPEPVDSIINAMVRSALAKLQSVSPGAPSSGSAVEFCLPILPSNQMEALTQQIGQQGAGYGQRYSVMAAQGVDEECERELEKEEEQEEEKEEQVARVQPAEETDWDYGSALVARSPRDLKGRCSGTGLPLLTMSELVRHLEPPALGQLSWSGQVLATHNFVFATRLPPTARLNNYLHKVSWLLHFPERGDLLMISDREADGIIAAMRGRLDNSSTTPDVMQLGYVLYARQHQPSPPLMLALPAGSKRARTRSLPTSQIMSLHLFNGGTMYAGDEQEHLRRMVRGRKEEVETLCTMRGTLSLLPRSELERAADMRLA